jgi:hypothetical protein
MANQSFAFLLVVICLIGFGESKLSKLSALRQSIFANYDHLVKPDEQVTVRFGIGLLNLEICPHKQVNTFLISSIFFCDSDVMVCVRD